LTPPDDRSLHYRAIPSPVGMFLLMRTGSGEIRTAWAAHTEQTLDGVSEDALLLPELADRLRAYFDGAAVDFRDVPIARGTRFQQDCWRSTRMLGHGRIGSYAEIAEQSGNPRAVRAVGLAMRRNPQPVITPCHRVITSSGGLGGFIGSDDPGSDPLQTKSWLLRMEGHGIDVTGEICRVNVVERLHGHVKSP